MVKEYEPFILSYIATMFFGVQFESIDKRRFKVIELASGSQSAGGSTGGNAGGSEGGSTGGNAGGNTGGAEGGGTEGNDGGD